MQRGGLAHLVNPGRGIPDLIRRGEILPDVAVVPNDDPQLGRIQSRDDPGAERFERVAVLGAKQRAIRPLPLPLTDVVPDAVAEHVIQRLLFRDVARRLADDHRELALGLHRSRALLGHDDLVLWADDRAHRPKLRLGPGRVFRRLPSPLRHGFQMSAIIRPGGVEDGRDHGRQELHVVEAMAGLGDRVFFERTACDLDDPIVFDDAVADV